jgi:hypothetical protein
MLAGLAFVVLVGRRTGRVGSVASSWSIVIVAVALLNTSAGHHKVDEAVQRESDPTRQIAMLSQGIREASSNLFVGGTCASFLMTVGGFLALRKPPVEPRKSLSPSW